MVALTRNLDLIGSSFLTGLTTVFVTRLRQGPAWQMRTLVLLICRHHSYCSPFPTAVFYYCCGGIIVVGAFPTAPDSICFPMDHHSQFPNLPSFHHPANQCSRGDAYRKGRRNRQYRVALDALSRVIQEFFGSIAALFRGTPHYSHAILYQIGDRAGCTRSPVS
jgi:hypothetical protein